jgi:hypothetical protein
MVVELHRLGSFLPFELAAVSFSILVLFIAVPLVRAAARKNAGAGFTVCRR